MTYSAFIVMCIAFIWLSRGVPIRLFTILIIVVGVMMGLG